MYVQKVSISNYRCHAIKYSCPKKLALKSFLDTILQSRSVCYGTAPLGSLDAWQGCFSISISAAYFSRQALDTRLPRYYYCISWTHQYFSNVLLDWAQNSLLVHQYGLKCEPSPTKNAIKREKKSSSLQAFKKSRKEKVKYIKKCKKKNCNKQNSLSINNYSFQ